MIGNVQIVTLVFVALLSTTLMLAIFLTGLEKEVIRLKNVNQELFESWEELEKLIQELEQDNTHLIQQNLEMAKTINKMYK